MQIELATRRRALLITYQRYLDSDRAWNAALRETRAWFPSGDRPGSLTIGNPGSPIRRLYEQRERALLQLYAARVKLETARQRLTAKRRNADVPRVMLITCSAL